jgi:predicted dehydrogenase
MLLDIDKKILQGGGCVTLIGSHVIDLVHFITGKKAKRVHGIVRTFRQVSFNISIKNHI